MTNPRYLQSSGNIIEGNYIGTDVTGTIARPNNNRGVGIGESEQVFQTSNNRVGGTTPQARNVISGNIIQGVRNTWRQLN